MKAVPIFGLLSLCLLLLGPSEQTAAKGEREPVGHVLRIFNVDSVSVRRDGGLIPVTKQMITKGFLLYAGDEIITPKKGRVLWVQGNEVFRKPSAVVEEGKLPLKRGGTVIPNSFIHARSLSVNEEDLINQIVAKKDKDNVFLSWKGEPMRLIWATKPGVDARSITFRAGSISETMALSDASQHLIGPLYSAKDERIFPTSSKFLEQIPRGETFEVLVNFSDGSKDVKKFRQFVGSQSNAGSLLISSESFSTDSESSVFSILESGQQLERLGCELQAAYLIIQWWMKEPNDYSLRGVVRGIAAEMDVPLLKKATSHL